MANVERGLRFTGADKAPYPIRFNTEPIVKFESTVSGGTTTKYTVYDSRGRVSDGAVYIFKEVTVVANGVTTYEQFLALDLWANRATTATYVPVDQLG